MGHPGLCRRCTWRGVESPKHGTFWLHMRSGGEIAGRCKEQHLLSDTSLGVTSAGWSLAIGVIVRGQGARHHFSYPGSHKCSKGSRLIRFMNGKQDFPVSQGEIWIIIGSLVGWQIWKECCSQGFEPWSSTF